MTLRWYESAFLRHFKLCLTLLNHRALQRGHKHVRIFSILQHEMPLISWIKGDHLIIPGALDQGGRSRAPARVVLSWWKEVDGGDPSPLPAVCPRLLHAGAPLGDSAEPPRSKSQYWNNHKDNTYPWKRHASSHPGLCSQLPTFRGGGVLNLLSRQLSHLHQQETIKFVLWIPIQQPPHTTTATKNLCHFSSTNQRVQNLPLNCRNKTFHKVFVSRFYS